jgi:hypothetical protein
MTTDCPKDILKVGLRKLHAGERHVSDEQQVERKRPIWVWLLSLFFLLSAIWTLLSFYMIWSGAIPLGPTQQAYFDRLTPIDYALTIVIGLLNLSAAIALFLLRKIARDLFLASLGLSLILVAWQAATKGWVEALGGAGFVGVLIGYILLIVVCIYAWHLRKKGVLR